MHMQPHETRDADSEREIEKERGLMMIKGDAREQESRLNDRIGIGRKAALLPSSVHVRVKAGGKRNSGE